jgi:hypothetical protein
MSLLLFTNRILGGTFATRYILNLPPWHASPLAASCRLTVWCGLRHKISRQQDTACVARSWSQSQAAKAPSWNASPSDSGTFHGQRPRNWRLCRAGVCLGGCVHGRPAPTQCTPDNRWGRAPMRPCCRASKPAQRPARRRAARAARRRPHRRPLPPLPRWRRSLMRARWRWITIRWRTCRPSAGGASW